MAIVRGEVGPTGPIADLFVGVSSRRAQLLRAQKLRVPPLYHLRVLIDTGSTVSGFSSAVFSALGLQPVTRREVSTPANTPDALHQADFFDVAIHLVAEGRTNLFGDLRVMAADCWLPGEGVQGLIGWDILDRCFFECHGPSRTYTLAF